MGGLPETFFPQTPRLLAAVMEGRARAARTEFNRTAWLAHTINSLERSAKLPPLARLIQGPDIERRPVNEPRPIENLMSLCRIWQAAVPEIQA